VKAIAKPEAMERGAHSQFRLRMLLSHGSHDAAAERSFCFDGSPQKKRLSERTLRPLFSPLDALFRASRL
jgi:hypothetical protein